MSTNLTDGVAADGAVRVGAASERPSVSGRNGFDAVSLEGLLHGGVSPARLAQADLPRSTEWMLHGGLDGVHSNGVVAATAAHFDARSAFRSELTRQILRIGELKTVLARTDTQVIDAEGMLIQRSRQVVERALETPRGAIISDYFTAASRYLRDGNVEPFRQLVHRIFDIHLVNGEWMKRDLAQCSRPVIFFNHYNRGAEVNGFADSPRLGSDLVGHDFTPLLAKMLTQRALAPMEIEITRFGKPLYPNDEFYERSAAQLGNRKISPDGVKGFSVQMAEEWARGRIPTVCPEGGLRALHPNAWRTGGVVSAMMAGADAILIIAESPWITLLDPEKRVVYGGAVRLPEGGRDFSNEVPDLTERLRIMMGNTIAHAGFDPVYTQAVRVNMERTKEPK